MLNMKRIVLWCLLVVSISFAAQDSEAAAVKKSGSGICHDRTSPWYDRTRTYDSYMSVPACLADGGRLPASTAGAATPRSGDPAPERRATPDAYNREQHFGGWRDDSGNCLNTRHEMLEALSTGATHKDGCRVIHGRWNDPYTGKIFTNASDLEVDHLVPLKWAWDRGADKWTDSRRRTFANDMRNLFVTETAINRAKGSKGPLDWLPPNRSFQCEYILRFERVTRIYALEIPMHEQASMMMLQKQLCGR